MSQDIFSEEFARAAFAAGNAARQDALDAGLAVTSFDEKTGQYYVDQNGHRFLAEVVNGRLQTVGEIKTTDAA